MLGSVMGEGWSSVSVLLFYPYTLMKSLGLILQSKSFGAVR